MGDIELCRILLSRLKNVAMERSWRTVMEGGLMEYRQGNVDVARQILNFLMHNVRSFPVILTRRSLC